MMGLMVLRVGLSSCSGASLSSCGKRRRQDAAVWLRIDLTQSIVELPEIVETIVVDSTLAK